LGLVVIGTASCATVSRVRWEKAGVSPAELQRDETDCTSRATLDTGATTTQRMSTTTSTPVDPQRRVSPVDSMVYEDCMRTRGYERIAPAN
jgi:hypothetical protein